MKKIYLLSLLSLLLVTFQSCTKEPENTNPSSSGGKTLFTATLEGLEGEETGSFWSPNTKIKVVMTDKSSVVANLIAGTGTENGSFMASVPTGKTPEYAVYPMSALVSTGAEGPSLDIPATQYGYLDDCKIATGKVNVGNKVAFKNVAAILPITLKAGADVSKLEISSVDGSALAGAVSVSFTEDGIAAGAVENPSSTVSMDVYSAGTYYFAVLPGVTHAQGIKVSYYLSEDPVTAAGEVMVYGENTVFEANTLAEEVELKVTSADMTFYISVEGAGTQDGKSWENAMSGAAFYKMLTDAVYVAPEEPEVPEDTTEPVLANESSESTVTGVAAFNGGVFNFAAGTYDFGEATSLTYDEVVGFELIGGFDAATGNRDVANNVTTFTGNKTHRIFNFGTEMQVNFDGISFVDGYSDANGGALSLNAGTWAFTDCKFSANEAAVNGGVMYFSAAGTATFDNCEFTDNKTTDVEAGLGGCIYCGSKTSALVLTVNGGTVSGNTAFRGGFIVSYNADATFNNVTFTGNKTTGGGGAIYTNSSPEFTLNDCVFTENEAKYGGAVNASGTLNVNGCRFENNYAAGNAGAISMGAKGHLNVNPLDGEATLFKDNKAEKYSGALSVETRNSGTRVNGALFVGNSAQWGGAVGVYGPDGQTTKAYFADCVFGGTNEGDANYAFENESKSGRGGAIFHEDDSYPVLTRVKIIGNYAENNGGAIAVMGWNTMTMFQTEFIGNHAKSGGAIYTEPASDKYADMFIDECSFDAHYITGTYGTTMNINGINSFCMNNSSIRGSYNTKSQSGDKASWVAMDVVQSFTSISNCSIIGNTQYGDGTSFTTVDGAGLVALWGNNHYFTNNIIVPEAEGVASILGGGSDEIDLAYTHYNTASKVTATDNGGNTTGLTSAALGSLAWTDGYWMWNGQINGAAPALMTQEAVLARLNTICPDFVTWCESDIYTDQRNVARGESWWPGAYQNN